MPSSQHTSYEERRESPRAASSSSVSYATRGVAYEDFLLDISAGGVFIETRAAFVVGQTLDLTFPMPGHRHFITVTGRVVRVEGDGIGVQFDQNIKELLGVTAGF